MKHQIEQRQQRGEDMPVHPEGTAQDDSRQAHTDIKLQPSLRPQAHNDRILSSQAVIIPIPEIIDNQEGVDDQTASQRSQENLGCDHMQLHVIGAAHRDDAEEHQHKQITQSLIREESGIEEGEDHADDAHENHLEPTIIDQRQSDDASHTSGEGDGLLHRIELHPSLCTSPSRPQSRLCIIRTVGKIEEVVDEVRIDLHGEGEEQTEQRSCPAELSTNIAWHIDPSQCHTNHHRHRSPR